MTSDRCIHCGKLPGFSGRGLCVRCHRNREIRESYPSRKGYRPPQVFDHEPTMDELDRMVEERYATMPGRNRRDDD